MFRTDILQAEWVILALAAGLALVLGIALYYLTLWQPRRGAGTPPAKPAPPAGGRRAWFLPPLLALAYGLALAFVVVYTLVIARHPPNW